MYCLRPKSTSSEATGIPTSRIIRSAAGSSRSSSSHSSPPSTPSSSARASRRYPSTLKWKLRSSLIAVSGPAPCRRALSWATAASQTSALALSSRPLGSGVPSADCPGCWPPNAGPCPHRVHRDHLPCVYPGPQMAAPARRMLAGGHQRRVAWRGGAIRLPERAGERGRGRTYMWLGPSSPPSTNRFVLSALNPRSLTSSPNALTPSRSVSGSVPR